MWSRESFEWHLGAFTTACAVTAGYLITKMLFFMVLARIVGVE